MRRPNKITILRSSWNNFTVVFERFPDGPATLNGLTYDEMLGAITGLTIPIDENGPLFRFEELFLGPTEKPEPEPPFDTTVEAPAPQAAGEYPTVTDWDCWNPTHPVGSTVRYYGILHRVVDAGQRGRRLAAIKTPDHPCQEQRLQETSAPRTYDKPRKRKRKQTMRERIEAWCADRAVLFIVSNDGQRWEFHRDNRKLVWWPTTTRVARIDNGNEVLTHAKGRKALLGELDAYFFHRCN